MDDTIRVDPTWLHAHVGTSPSPVDGLARLAATNHLPFRTDAAHTLDGGLETSTEATGRVCTRQRPPGGLLMRAYHALLYINDARYSVVEVLGWILYESEYFKI